jgi:hypothetical protein
MRPTWQDLAPIALASPPRLGELGDRDLHAGHAGHRAAVPSRLQALPPGRAVGRRVVSRWAGGNRVRCAEDARCALAFGGPRGRRDVA